MSFLLPGVGEYGLLISCIRLHVDWITNASRDSHHKLLPWERDI